MSVQTNLSLKNGDLETALQSLTHPIFLTGDCFVLPAIDCPPWAFDPMHYTFDSALAIFDRTTAELIPSPDAIMTYFTNQGGERRMAGGSQGRGTLGASVYD